MGTFKIGDGFISLEDLFESMPVALALLDREGRHVALNRERASFSGLAPTDLYGRKVAELSAESGENIKRDFRLFDEGKEVPDHEVVIGDRVYLVSARPVRNEDGLAVGEMVALKDITRNKEIEREIAEANRRLEYLAHHDSLTGVLNARTFYEVCDRLIVGALRGSRDFSVLFIDLDHFKRVNDTYGHDAGDQVLKTVVARVAKAKRESDVLGRVGGEEFALFLPDTDHDGALSLGEKIRAAVSASPIPVREAELRMTASVGVASRMDHHASIADLQRDADHAMYHAKRAGRDRVASLDRPCYVETAKDGA